MSNAKVDLCRPDSGRDVHQPGGFSGHPGDLSVFIMLPHNRAEQANLLLMIMAVIETNPAQLTCCYWTYRVNRAQNWLVGSTDMSRPPQVRPDVRPVDGSTVVL